MGAWGVKPFENDGAGDFEAELCHAHPQNPDFLRETLESIDPGAYLEIDAGQAAIACAAIVAVLHGLEHDDLPDRVRAWIAANQPYDPAPLIPLALHALALVVSDADSSEIYDAWQATADFDDWQQSVERIAGYLRLTS